MKLSKLIEELQHKQEKLQKLKIDDVEVKVHMGDNCSAIAVTRLNLVAPSWSDETRWYIELL